MGPVRERRGLSLRVTAGRWLPFTRLTSPHSLVKKKFQDRTHQNRGVSRPGAVLTARTERWGGLGQRRTPLRPCQHLQHRSWQSRAALKPDASPHLRGSAPSPLSPKALFWDPLTWEARGAQQHHPTKHKTAPWSTALTSSGEQDRKGALGSHSFPECLPICRTALEILYTQLLSRQPCDIVTLLEITSFF